MTPLKRAFDVLVALVLLVPLLPIGLVVAVLILISDGRPVFYRSERMRGVDEAFVLVKFRTMTLVDRDDGVSGQDKAHRITKLGQVLRRRRLDEIPQIWNVLVGDISFVGPRPPLRKYVDQFPALYGAVLKSRPGITGLATLVFKDHEAKLLAECTTAEETDAVYARRCVPQKARLDLIYQQNRSLCWDVVLMFQTILGRG